MDSIVDTAVRPLSPHLGADVEEGDLLTLAASGDTDAIARLKHLLERYLVLRFHATPLAPPQLVAFAQALGPTFSDRIKPTNPQAMHFPDLPEIKVLTNAVTEDGRPLGDGSTDEQFWHCDGTHRPEPAAYSLLYGVVTPKHPPRTFWMNMYTVYDFLPDDLRHAISGLSAIHATENRSNSTRDIYGPSIPVERRSVGPVHPLVRVNVETYRRSLFLPRRRDALIVGLTPEESREILERVWNEAMAATCFWGTAVQENDLVIWDNRFTLHRRESWPPTQARTVYQLNCAPERPVGCTAEAA